MDDEHATAYISAGPIAEDGAANDASAPAITKESKVGRYQTKQPYASLVPYNILL